MSLIFNQIEPVDGLRENPPRVWALTHAKVYIEPGTYLGNATIVIRDGFIENVGRDIRIPNDATVLDLTGKTIYSGFIDSWVEISTQPENTIPHDAHWNHKVNARRELYSQYQPVKKKLESLHKMGFTAAHIVPDSGIFQGQTALVQLNNEGTVLISAVAQDIAYEVDGWGSDKYPNSLLGVVALLRQTLMDATWYGEANAITKQFPKFNEPLKGNRDLDVFSNWRQENKPFIFETNQELSVLRSFNISDEFQLNSWIRGSGYEYRRISEIAKVNPFIILPLDFPVTPDLSHPYQALSYSTSELKHWDLAADNPAILIDHGVSFAFTSHGLKGNEFRKNLIRSIERGLSETDALAALTTIPAEKMGKGNQLGKIEQGFLANLTIVDGNYFQNKSKIVSTWIGGEEYPVLPKYDTDIAGEWKLTMGKKWYQLELKKKNNSYSGSVIQDTTNFKLSKLKIGGRFISWQVTLDSTAGPSRFTGHILENRMEGTAHDLQLSWSALKIGGLEKEEKKEEDKENSSELSVYYPEGTYGLENDVLQDAKSILIQNTTVWTCGKQGKLEGVDILFEGGKVKKIGYSLNSKGVTKIDGTGKHITPGLIDCHSHSAAFSINEGTQSITAEVRIQDVMNSDDITIYRQLAGGLTMANILHGSANTIGGQNAVIKMRWGATPEYLLYENAMPGIKLALGENVKQSNWGDENTTRYPQTRMGVEQILRDAFASAVEYQNEWIDFRKNNKKWKKKIPPRQDLELDALVEILEGKRQIHCHSYRQDEILMLTRVAEDFGFTVGTFQHVLEGYKVADRLKEHGANASTFSDWWAYKYEVIDAIPYNGALMTDVGVTVSFNSDSRELARRMNTEAAKGMKYGNLSEEEALKLVTINPAIQLNIDKWVGSLEVGKDADFVIWSDHPLSTRAKCEQTWIDGVQYFSLEKDAELKARDTELRDKLVGKILSKKSDSKGKKWNHSEKKSVDHHNCLEEL
ncbi:MAG: amidohydrolase family protein [Candidatus Marinimicrobia bacterium]|nr:amidohydrolase family protein [Candidatus Neomarinimicrobiota bacterium]